MRFLASLTLVATVGGCLSVPQPVSTPRAALLDEATLALSCQELAARNTKIQNRIRELEAENKRQRQQEAVAGAIVEIGLTALVGASVSGGVHGVRTASTAANAATAVRNAESAQSDLAQVQDALALGSRSAELNRAMVEKGC